MGKKCEDLEKDKYSYVCICTISVDVIIQNHKSHSVGKKLFRVNILCHKGKIKIRTVIKITI